MNATTALVTGSSRGIGAAIAADLRARGIKVIGHATKAADPETIGADLTDPTAAGRIWDEALERAGGRIDLLVNNAGQFVANPLGLSDIAWLDNWEDALRINLTAAAELSRYAVKAWLADGNGGRIVHIASRAAYRGDSPDHWHYAAAKGGMIALHKTIAAITRHRAS